MNDILLPCIYIYIATLLQWYKSREKISCSIILGSGFNKVGCRVIERQRQDGGRIQ